MLGLKAESIRAPSAKARPAKTGPFIEPTAAMRRWGGTKSRKMSTIYRLSWAMDDDIGTRKRRPKILFISLVIPCSQGQFVLTFIRLSESGSARSKCTLWGSQDAMKLGCAFRPWGGTTQSAKRARAREWKGLNSRLRRTESGAASRLRSLARATLQYTL